MKWNTLRLLHRFWSQANINIPHIHRSNLIYENIDKDLDYKDWESSTSKELKFKWTLEECNLGFCTNTASDANLHKQTNFTNQSKWKVKVQNRRGSKRQLRIMKWRLWAAAPASHDAASNISTSQQIRVFKVYSGFAESFLPVPKILPASQPLKLFHCVRLALLAELWAFLQSDQTIRDVLPALGPLHHQHDLIWSFAIQQRWWWGGGEC